MPSKISLSLEDPTVFTRCDNCCRRGVGSKFGDVYLKAFTTRKWKREPVCENCGSKLTVLYEIE